MQRSGLARKDSRKLCPASRLRRQKISVARLRVGRRRPICDSRHPWQQPRQTERKRPGQPRSRWDAQPAGARATTTTNGADAPNRPPFAPNPTQAISPNRQSDLPCDTTQSQRPQATTGCQESSAWEEKRSRQAPRAHTWEKRERARRASSGDGGGKTARPASSAKLMPLVSRFLTVCKNTVKTR